MAKTKTLLTLVLLAASLVVALELYAQESLPVRELQAVTITESRLSEYAVGAKTSQFDSALLALRPTASLADLLTDYSSSHIKAYGNGMLATISFRGTGPEHTAVLWNGINIAYPMLGQTDFSGLSLTYVSKLLIV